MIRRLKRFYYRWLVYGPDLYDRAIATIAREDDS